MGVLVGRAKGSGLSVRVLNYSIENRADVSDAYLQAVSRNSSAEELKPVGAVEPVGYTTAEANNVNSLLYIEKAQKMQQKLNDIASEYKESATGYDVNRKAVRYQLVGTNIDILG